MEMDFQIHMLNFFKIIVVSFICEPAQSPIYSGTCDLLFSLDESNCLRRNKGC